jgi:CheY-like chemotaxis protein
MSDLPVILVIEDDELIQGMVDEALTGSGFDVAIAGSGEEAVNLLKGGKTKYRARLTGINRLGGIGGWEVAKQARSMGFTWRP